MATHHVRLTVLMPPNWAMVSNAMEDCYDFEDKLAGSVYRKRAGRFTGNSVSDEGWNYHFEGEDADLIHKALEFQLKKPICLGSTLIKCYGDPDDPDTRQVIIKPHPRKPVTAG